MIRFARAIGANTDFLTAQAFVFPKTYASESLTDQLFLGVIISGSGEDVFAKVRQSAPQVEEKFTDPSSVGIAEKVSEIANLIKEQLKDVENLQFIIACWKDGALYLQRFGNTKAFLLRNDIQLELTTQGGDDQLISGHLKEGDKLLLISPQTAFEWEEDQLNELLQSKAEDLEEELTMLQQQHSKIDPVAAVLIENPPEEKKSEYQAEIPEINSYPDPSSHPKIKFNPLSVLTKLKQIMPKSRKRILILAGVTLILIFALGYFLNFQKNKSKLHTESQNFYILAKDKYSKAQAFKDSDLTQAQSNLTEAQSDLNKSLQIEPQNQDALNLKKELETNSDSILKVFNINDWPLFLSLDLIKKDFNSKRMSLSLGKILLLDDRDKTLVALDLKTKKPQILAGALQLGQASFGSINGSNVFTYSPDKGISRIDLEDDSPKPSVIAKPDTDWGMISDIVAFSGNVYALDSVKNQIYKYTPVKSGFSDKISYLRPDQKSDFGGAKRMSIDYSVWVLKSGPEIIKFTGGYADGFSVSGLDKNLEEIQSFFVAEGETIKSENSYAYFLDSNNGRIVVLKKTGQYISQYKGDKFKTASDFVVDEKEKKLYLLDSGRIYQLELKN